MSSRDDEALLSPERDGQSINANGGVRVPLLDSSSYATSSLESSLRSVDSQYYAQDFSYVSTDLTAAAIKLCEKFILTPYSKALKLIGWLPYRNSRCGYVCQMILVFLWFVCIVGTFITQILSCFKRDAFVPGKTITLSETTLGPPNTLATRSMFSMDFDLDDDNTTTGFQPFTFAPSDRIIQCERHVISSLVLGDCVLLTAYFFGVYLFVRGESDYLFGLASHVFIKNSEAQSSSKRLIATIGTLFILGTLWILFSLTVRVLTAVAVELFNDDISILWDIKFAENATLNFMISGTLKIFLVVISLLGFLTFDSVYMFAILNYVVQSEMNIYLLWDIRKLIETKKHDDIDGAIKDMHKSKQYLDILNGRTAALTGLSLFILGNLAMTAIIDLNRLDETKLHISNPYQVLAAVSAVLNVICWCLLVSLPFIQAARVTYWCEKLKDMGPEVRARLHAPYRNVKLLDLDSLLSFLRHLDLRATLFGVPIYPWLLYLVLVAFCFTMLILFQVDTYSVGTYV